MKIVLHTPYGTLSQESGLLYLLANYLKTFTPEGSYDLAQLQCNGAFALCDRDGERGWKRGVHSCLNCMSDQGSLAAWSGIERLELTRYLSSDEVVVSRRWLLGVPSEDLLDLEYMGTKLYPLCADSFAARFGVTRPDLRNKQHEPVLRRLLLSTMRALFAARRFAQAESPELLLVAGGQDFITRTVAHEAKDTQVALFQWVPSQRLVQIVHPNGDQTMACELLLEGVTEMRNDAKTWSPDLVAILTAILRFLDVPLEHRRSAVAQ